MGVIAKSGACVISIVTQISFGAVTARNIYWQKGLNIKYLGGLNTRGPFQVTWSVMGCCTTPEKKRKRPWHILTRTAHTLWECAVISSRQSSQIGAPKIASQGTKMSIFFQLWEYFATTKQQQGQTMKNNGWTCHSVTIFDTILTHSSCIIWPCHHLLALTDLQKVKVKSQSLLSFPQAFYDSEQPGNELKENKRMRKTSQCFWCSHFQ